MNDYLYILENNRRINIYASLKYMLQKNISLYIFYYYKFLCKLFHIIHTNIHILYILCKQYK